MNYQGQRWHIPDNPKTIDNGNELSQCDIL